MRSVYDSIKATHTVLPIAATGSPTSVAVDTFGYNSAMFHATVGLAGPAGGTPTSFSVAVKIQESATSSGTYTDISGATADAITGTNKSVQIRVEGLGSSARMRYLKVVMTPTFVGGTSPSIVMSAVALLGNAFTKPVENSGTPA